FSKTWDEHLIHLRAVFDRLRKAGLRLNLAKSKFARHEQKFLGFIVSQEGVKADPAKIQAMLEFPTPQSVSDIRAFLGTTGFYRRFVKNYSTVAYPLIRLMRKGVPFAWGRNQQTSFDELKKRMTNIPILAYPDFSKRFLL